MNHAVTQTTLVQTNDFKDLLHGAPPHFPSFWFVRFVPAGILILLRKRSGKNREDKRHRWQDNTGIGGRVQTEYGTMVGLK